MPSLYRRMSLWFNRRGSDSTSHSKSSNGSASSTPSASPSVTSSPSQPAAACSTSLPPSSCVLSRTAPSAYTYDPQTNSWLNNDNGSVLLHEPVDMSYTPHPTQHINAKTTNTILISQPSIDASSSVNLPAASSSATAATTISTTDTSAVTMSAPTRHRRLVRPRHFTFSDAHVSRSGQGRLARTTAFF